MPTPPALRKLLFLLALLPGVAQAQGRAHDLRFQAALAVAESGGAVDTSLSGHPLYGWLEYARLRRDVAQLSQAQAEAFLARYRGQAVAEVFRESWLSTLAQRQDWSGFRSAWRPGIDSVALRCAELTARAKTGTTDAQWTRDAQALYRSGKSLPAECDAAFDALATSGGLTPTLRWERIELAAAEWQPGVMRSAARGLPAGEIALANDYAAFVEAVHPRALDWPKTARSRLIASHGLARLAKSVPGTGEAQLPRYADALDFSEVERGRVLYQSALWTAASYEPESARRLAAVPESAYDDKLHEWRVREALARSDWRGALAAIRKMPTRQREDSRWTYFEARVAGLTGDTAASKAAYARAARKPDFHGFLAADRLGQPYALCPWLPVDSAAAKTAVARDPAILRAMALYALDRSSWAQREWDEALTRFDDAQRRQAVEVAQQHGWFDRAVFSLGKTPAGEARPDELRLYRLRFPLQYQETIRREAARHSIDPAWVAAEIRAESIFNPRARSSANALGLMQVLPGTGQQVARKLGLPWGGSDSLYQPETSIALGTAYLRQMLDRYGGQPYFAIAAYNAGPAPVSRWQTQRPGMDADFWIETISYKETRDYVARVLAFSVLYDWRLDGTAVPVSDRMRGRTGTPRKRFTCPLAQPAPA